MLLLDLIHDLFSEILEEPLSGSMSVKILRLLSGQAWWIPMHRKCWKMHWLLCGEGKVSQPGCKVEAQHEKTRKVKG